MATLSEMIDRYCGADILKGYGLFTGGRLTMIYETSDGLYATIEKSDIPPSSWTFAGSGWIDHKGKVHVTWVD